MPRSTFPPHASAAHRPIALLQTLCLLLAASGCRRPVRGPVEPPEPVDAQHTVSAGSLYNNMLLITRSCGNGPFLSVAQQVIVRENPSPGVVVVLDPADKQTYNSENTRSLVALLRQQTSSSLESGPQQMCVEQFADHLAHLVSAAESMTGR